MRHVRPRLVPAARLALGASLLAVPLATLAAQSPTQRALASWQEALDRGLATLRRNYERSVARGSLKPEQMEQRLALIAPSLAYAALAEEMAAGLRS